jgi:hypothetical protein
MVMVVPVETPDQGTPVAAPVINIQPEVEPEMVQMVPMVHRQQEGAAGQEVWGL